MHVAATGYLFTLPDLRAHAQELTDVGTSTAPLR